MHWLGCLALIFLPLSFAVYSFFKASSWKRNFSDRVLRCSVSAMAQVVDAAEETVVDKQDGISSTWFYPIVCFSAQGKQFRVRCEERWNPLPFEIGDRLEIWYNPNNPNDIHLEGKYCCIGRNYAVPMVIAMICGAITIGCTVFSIWYTL